MDYSGYKCGVWLRLSLNKDSPFNTICSPLQLSQVHCEYKIRCKDYKKKKQTCCCAWTHIMDDDGDDNDDYFCLFFSQHLSYKECSSQLFAERINRNIETVKAALINSSFPHQPLIMYIPVKFICSLSDYCVCVMLPLSVLSCFSFFPGSCFIICLPWTLPSCYFGFFCLPRHAVSFLYFLI